MTTWIIRLLLVVLPVAVAFYWLWLRKNQKDDEDRLRAKEIRLIFASAIAFIVLLVLMVFVIPRGGGRPDDIYIAPYEKDGKIIPGEFLSPEEAKKRGLFPEKVTPQDKPLETFGDE